MSWLSDEARLFLLKEKLTELRRNKKYALIGMVLPPFIGGTVQFLLERELEHSSIFTDILIALFGTIFLVFLFSYYMHARNEEKEIMKQIEEMAYGREGDTVKDRARSKTKI